MFRKFLAATAFAVVAVASLGSANAMPSTAMGSPVAGINANIEHVDWRRVCDRDGDHCRRVWVDDDHDRRPPPPPPRRHRECGPDGDHCRWIPNER